MSSNDETVAELLDILEKIQEVTGTEQYELEWLPGILAHRENERLRAYKRLEQIQQITDGHSMT